VSLIDFLRRVPFFIFLHLQSVLSNEALPLQSVPSTAEQWGGYHYFWILRLGKSNAADTIE
jgi:hypothetical protein